MTRALAVQRIAVPVAHRPARALDDRHERGEVVKLQSRLDHQVDMAVREQAVIIAVAAEEHSLVRRLCGERHEMLAVMVAEILRAGRREHGVGKIAAGARCGGGAVEPGWTPRRVAPVCARNPLVDETDQMPAVLPPRDQRDGARAARPVRTEKQPYELQLLMRTS